MNFETIWKMICDKSTLGEPKSRNLYLELLESKDIPGNIAEIGVYKGQTAKMMNLVLPNKVLHLYDTFKGIVETDMDSHHRNGDFSASFDMVSKFVGYSNVKYHEGMFPDTFKEYGETFSLVHSDTDTYFGTKASLELIVPRLSLGGKLIVDDYKWVPTPGVEKAIVEFLEENTVPIETRVATGHQFVITRI
jgi:O-methyltransferase